MLEGYFKGTIKKIIIKNNILNLHFRLYIFVHNNSFNNTQPLPLYMTSSHLKSDRLYMACDPYESSIFRTT